MSQLIVKSHYSAAELAEMRLPMLPTTKASVINFAERSIWNFIEVTGRGGMRREYAPPAPVMAAIKETLVQRIISGDKHDQAVPVDPKYRQKSGTNGPQRVGQNNLGGNATHTEKPSGGTQPQPGLLRCVASPVEDQSQKSAPNGITPASQARVHRVIESLPAQSGTPGTPSSALKDWQKRTAEARVMLLREVERIAQLVGKEKAITKVVIMAQDGTLPEHLAQLVPVANARSGQDGKRTLSRRTMYKWFEGYTPGAVNALAPKDQHAAIRIPAWAVDLMAEYQRPQKPSLAWAVEQIAAKHGIEEQNLYHRARRFMQKMGNVELQAGRMGARDIKNIKPFIRRDSSMLWPAEVYSADGHAFDAEIAHPAHGRPFRPEITTVRDINTRKAVGWSVDLAESGLAVLDALRNACETGGICSLFYVDHGSGFDNALQSAPGIGMESRLGYTKTHSLPYNSQARGVVEKGHKDMWVRAAKELATYMGKDMDAEAKNKVFKITRKDIKTGGVSKYLMPWTSFLQFVVDHVERYNNRPHRSLATIYDADLGKKRHMSPNEAWDAGVEAGAPLVTITPQESLELFRPMKEAKVLRGEIRLFSNLYFSKDLTEYHGDIVRVAYDVRNADLVWVYDQQGRFVCSAGFEANKRAYFPEAFLEQAARKRSEGRLSRLEVKRQEVLEELAGAPMRDITPIPDALECNTRPELQLVTEPAGPEPLFLEDKSASEAVIESPNKTPTARPTFMVESDRYEWLMQHRDSWISSDRKFLTEFVAGDIYSGLRERFEALELAWNGFDQEDFKVAV